MADPVHVRDYAFNRTGGTNVQTVNLAQTAGDFLILCIYWYQNNSDTATVTDGVDTWHKIPGTYQCSTGSGGGLGLSSCMFYKFATTTATVSTTITAPAGSGSSFTASQGSAFTHINTVQPVGQVNSAKADIGPTNPNSGNITTTFAKDVVYGSVYNDSNVGSAGSGFTAANVGFSNYLAQYQLTSSTGTFASTQTGGSASSWTAAVAELHGEDFVPKFTISGNAGVAGAEVTWVNGTGLLAGSVTADGSGDYIILDLANETYSVFPYLPSYTFGSDFLSVVISNADATGQDFVATPVTPVSYTYTKIGDDTFTQADGPLNPAKWTVVPGGFQPLAVVSNQCESSSSSPAQTSSMFYTGATFPDNVYVQAKVNVLTPRTLTTFPTLALDVRESSDGSVFSSLSILENPDGNLTALLLGSDEATGLFIYDLPWAPGDVFRAEFFDTLVALYQNGILIANGIIDGVVGGSFGDIFIQVKSAASDIQLSDYEFGSIAIPTPPPPGGGGGSGMTFGGSGDFNF